MIMCDIDGVLADVRPYVAEHLYNGKSDWKSYFAKQPYFQPISPMVEMIKSIMAKGTPGIIFVTGRPERTWDDTSNWLIKYLGGNYQLLLMRPSKYQGSTQDLKLSWFKAYRPNLIIDDDPEVVELATKAGFTVLQVHGYRWSNYKDYAPGEEVKER